MRCRQEVQWHVDAESGREEVDTLVVKFWRPHRQWAVKVVVGEVMDDGDRTGLRDSSQCQLKFLVNTVERGKS